jgi:isocitrate/isopropylmalate dehydrogenase
MSANVPITVAYGDGIGPEIVAASLHIIQEAGARIDLSLDVTARKMLGLYADIPPCVAYHPFIRAKHAGMDVLNRVLDQGLEIVKIETLRNYNGRAGYTLSRGQ